MQRWAPSFRPLLLWLLLPWPGAGQFQVKGPSSPVTARLGEAAVLPCHLSPPEDAQDMEIRWYRDHQSVLVHEYGDSQDHMEQQSLQYQGRTELLRENITEGQVALRIHPVLPADEGQYSCVFVRSTQLSQAQFELLVSASGATPHIHIQPAHSGRLTLICSSSGWYPDPELQWWSSQGRPLSPDSVMMSLQEDGLIHVESSVTVDESLRAEVFCSIRNPVLREEKQSHLLVTEALFPRVSAWTVALPMLLAVTLMITFLLLLKSRKTKEHRKRSVTEMTEGQGQGNAFGPHSAAPNLSPWGMNKREVHVNTWSDPAEWCTVLKCFKRESLKNVRRLWKNLRESLKNLNIENVS